MRFILFVLSVGLLFGQPPPRTQALVPVSGMFQAPDGSLINGKATIQLTRSTVTNVCGTTIQVQTFRPIIAPITQGKLGGLTWNDLTGTWSSYIQPWNNIGGPTPLNLYASTCLSLAPPASKAPVVFVGLASGPGATVSVNGDNVSGEITLNTGTIPNIGPTDVFTTNLAFLPQSTLLTLVLTANVNGTQPYCNLIPKSFTFMGVPEQPGDPHYGNHVQFRFTLSPTTTTMILAATPVALAYASVYVWTYSCVQPYMVVVSDSNNNQLYQGRWSVPSSTSADVTQLDVN